MKAEKVSPLEAALRIALEAHAGQKERNNQPFVMHPLRVMARMNTDREQMLAILHEVLDQPGWTQDKLVERGIPGQVVHSLGLLKKQEGEDFNSYIYRCRHDSMALHVRLADLEDELDLRQMYDVTEQDRARLAQLLEAYKSLVIPTTPDGMPFWMNVEKEARRVSEREKLPYAMEWPED